MGGYGSTRWNYRGRRCTVEESYKLAIGEFSSRLRDFANRPYLSPACWQSVTVRWNRHGSLLAGVRASFGEGTRDTRHAYGGHRLPAEYRCSVTLAYEIGSANGGMPLDRTQVSELVGRPMRFGGVNWCFLCPRCHQLRTALYLPKIIGARDWACRRCHGLKYHSQRLEPTTRIECRMHKITRRVGSGEFLEFPWQKPKWMRWATFSRQYADWQRANEARDLAFCVRAYALLKRFNPSFATGLQPYRGDQ